MRLLLCASLSLFVVAFGVAAAQDGCSLSLPASFEVDSLGKTVIVSDLSCPSSPASVSYAWTFSQNCVVGSTPKFNPLTMSLITSDVCDGNLCTVTSCAGSIAIILPNTFPSKSTVFVTATATIKDSAGQTTIASATTEVMFTEKEFFVQLTNSAVTSDGSQMFLSMQYHLVNTNLASSVEYTMHCEAHDVNLESCPLCPPDANVVGIPTDPTKTLNWPLVMKKTLPVSGCYYTVIVDAILTTPSGPLFATASREMSNDIDNPVVVLDWTDETLLSCLSSRENDDFKWELAYNVQQPLNFTWEYTMGEMECHEHMMMMRSGMDMSDMSDMSMVMYFCGGDGFNFQYVPEIMPMMRRNMDECMTTMLTVTAYKLDSDVPVATTETCAITPFPAPTGGMCSFSRVTSKSSTDTVPTGFDIFSLDWIEVTCQDWMLPMGCAMEMDDTLTYRLTAEFMQSGNPNYYTPLLYDYDGSFQIPVGSNTTFVVEVCSSFGACARSDMLMVMVYPLSRTTLDTTMQAALSESQKMSMLEDFQTSWSLLFAISQVMPGCMVQSADEEELYMDVKMEVSMMYETLLEASNKDATLVADPTVLLWSWMLLSEDPYCMEDSELLMTLSMVAMAKEYSVLVATRCMDNVLGPFFMMPMMRENENDVPLKGMREREEEEDRSMSMPGSMGFVEVLNIAFTVNDELQVNTRKLGVCTNQMPVVTPKATNFCFCSYDVPIMSLREPYAVYTDDMTIYFPANFDQQVIKAAESLQIYDFSCVSMHLTRAPPYCTDMCLSSNISSITIRINEKVLPMGHMGVSLEGVIIRLKLLDSNSTEGWRREGKENRFDLTGGSNETTVMMDECAYYENGAMNTTGCTTLNMDMDYVNCSCIHFSNFGIMMMGGTLSSTVDNWTTFRIISLSLLLSMWVVLAIVFISLSLSLRLRMFFGVGTHSEKADAVLPPRAK